MSEEDKIVFLTEARIIPDYEVADSNWFYKFVNPAQKNRQLYIVGKYIEAGKANNNKQRVELKDLAEAVNTIPHVPLNYNHGPIPIGSFLGAELIYPVSGEAAEEELPYVEAVAVMWSSLYPEEANKIKKAYESGELYYSMEAVPSALECSECGREFAYEGPKSSSYCDHVNDRTAERTMKNPSFVGGALIVPPVRPGWSNADVKSLVAEKEAALQSEEDAREALKSMAERAKKPAKKIYMDKASYSEDQRSAFAKKGFALPDGSYPIATRKDLLNAIQSVGRSRNYAKARNHIISRAKKMNMENLLPQEWK